MKPLKIVHIYELGPQEEGVLIGGVEVALLELSKSLLRLGHEVTIVNGASKGTRDFSIDGVTVRNVDFGGFMKSTWNPSNLRLMRQIAFPIAALKANLDGYDIYHGHFYTSGLVANFLARRNGAVAVNTIHGSYYDIWRYLEPPIVSSMYRLAERILAPALAKMSGIQIHTGGYFANKVLSWGAPSEKVVTIHNGFDPKTFNPQTHPVEIPVDGTILFTARRLVEKNGLEYLIKAMPKIVEKYDAYLLIAGDGPHKPQLQRLAETLGLRKNILFIGLVPHQKLPPYIVRSDIVIIPSLMESSSLFLIESMACKKAVVASNVGGIPEVLNRNCGVLVKPMDESALSTAVLYLLSNDAVKNELAENAFQAVTNALTWDNAGRLTEFAYLKALGVKVSDDSQD
jgi:glycosyltransferase involved in cell wall biosynthesis